MSNKIQQLITLGIYATGIVGAVVTTSVLLSQLVSRSSTEASNTSVYAASLTQQTENSSDLASSIHAIPTQKTGNNSEVATPESLTIIRQQVEVAKEYEEYYLEKQDEGTGTRKDVLGASLVRMEYEIELLQAQQLFEESLVRRKQQIEVAKEYEDLQKLRLKMLETVLPNLPENAREAALTRLDYEQRLLEEEQALTVE